MTHSENLNQALDTLKKSDATAQAILAKKIVDSQEHYIFSDDAPANAEAGLALCHIAGFLGQNKQHLPTAIHLARIADARMPKGAQEESTSLICFGLIDKQARLDQVLAGNELEKTLWQSREGSSLEKGAAIRLAAHVLDNKDQEALRRLNRIEETKSVSHKFARKVGIFNAHTQTPSQAERPSVRLAQPTKPQLAQN